MLSGHGCACLVQKPEKKFGGIEKSILESKLIPGLSGQAKIRATEPPERVK